MKTLYRPVGLYELRLIAAGGYAAFSPRLAHQPIFYPVLNLDYAEQMARNWNTRDVASGYMGAVTAFEVEVDYLRQFEEQVVGAAMHRELWIPAEDLDTFNQHIVGKIRVLSAYYGEDYGDEREW